MQCIQSVSHLWAILALCASLSARGNSCDGLPEGCLPLIFYDNLPYLEASIGKQKLLLLFDSGANSSQAMIPKSIISLAPQIASKPGLQARIDTKGLSQRNQRYTLSILKLYHLTLNEVDIIDYTPWGYEIGPAKTLLPSPEGVITPKAFGCEPFLVDYQNQQLLVGQALQQQLQMRYHTRKQFKLVVSGEQSDGVVISINITSRALKMVLDTGANFSAIKKTSLPAHAPLTASKDLERLAPGLIYLTDALPVQLSPYIIQLSAIKADGLLGTDFFQQTAVLFDKARQHVVLYPYEIKN